MGKEEMVRVLEGEAERLSAEYQSILTAMAVSDSTRLALWSRMQEADARAQGARVRLLAAL